MCINFDCTYRSVVWFFIEKCTRPLASRSNCSFVVSVSANVFLSVFHTNVHNWSQLYAFVFNFSSAFDDRCNILNARKLETHSLCTAKSFRNLIVIVTNIADRFIHCQANHSGEKNSQTLHQSNPMNVKRKLRGNGSKFKPTKHIPFKFNEDSMSKTSIDISWFDPFRFSSWLLTKTALSCILCVFLSHCCKLYFVHVERAGQMEKSRH